MVRSASHLKSDLSPSVILSAAKDLFHWTQGNSAKDPFHFAQGKLREGSLHFQVLLA